MTMTEGNRIRLFVSHSSLDGELIGHFIDDILIMGAGVNRNEIAYTSREETGVTPGMSIPEFIKENISCADVVFLMISENYRKSEVCLNEMGAAWALEKPIVQVLLPGVTFSSLGWLLSLDKAVRIDDPSSLDAIAERLVDLNVASIRISAWNRYREKFLNSLTTAVPVVADSIGNEPEEYGILDYSEIYEAQMQSFSDKVNQISAAMNENSVYMSPKSEQLSKLNYGVPGSTKTAKSILRSIAASIDRTADVINIQADGLYEPFNAAIEAAIHMKALAENGMNDDEEDLAALLDLLKTMKESKASMEELITDVDKVPNAESSFIKAKSKMKQSVRKLNGVIDSCQERAKDLVNELV